MIDADSLYQNNSLTKKRRQTMEHGTNSKKPSFLQLGALAGFIMEFLAAFLNASQANYWLGNKTHLKRKLTEIFSDEYADVRRKWETFYRSWGQEPDFSKVVIPPVPKDGKWRLLIIAELMTAERAFTYYTTYIKKRHDYQDLNVRIKHTRTAAKDYAVWVRDAVEPDQEHLGKKPFKVDPDAKIGITLIERILLEIDYFRETGKVLDERGLTFCSGSRKSSNKIPVMARDMDGALRIDWYSPEYCQDKWGIRSVVSL
jgi:hypothetical protein